ncbi:hypothetical protein GJ698_03000 [Pseudoduganella sp. FT26W]|uniref:ABM domain-containing protein n=1 Tax=Duganella aquatilis TaxID=2666082 RepID=A0A844CQP4_9BURK|nr:hypothetical protein [Duganella aquatilis]MRW83057.1 hypothetical protein [Duganella aquatilis]
MATEAMEITTFYLIDGVTMKDFIAANADVDEWLQRQTGFILRRMCQGTDGLVTDMLLWQSAKDGERAARGVVTELAGSPVHAAIDQATVNWSVNTCRHRLPLSA